MTRIRSFFGAPFGSALLGGLVVGGFFWVALAAGLIDAKEGDSGGQAPLAANINSDRDSKKSGKAPTVSEIYENDGPGVVHVEAEVTRRQAPSPFELFPEAPQRRQQNSTGSGFVIDDEGHILTNAHVVAGAEKIRVGFGDNKTSEAKKIGQDTSTDLALLKVKVDKKLLHPLELGDSSKIRVGDPVVAIGNPFGLDRTVTSGIVSALQRRIEAPNGFTIDDVIQTDASINPGNSGGPLLDAEGKVLGINSQIATAGGGGSVGIGFAVPVNTARKVVDELRNEGKVRHAFLGITGIDLKPPVSDNLNLPADEGVLVQEVVDGGPADKAGIKAGSTAVTIAGLDLVLGGDIITKVDGKKVTEMGEVVTAVDSKKPGDEVELQILRGKKPRTVKVKLGERPERLPDQRPQEESPFGN